MMKLKRWQAVVIPQKLFNSGWLKVSCLHSPWEYQFKKEASRLRGFFLPKISLPHRMIKKKQRKKMKAKSIILLVAILLLQSCAVWTYGVSPNKAWDAKKIENKESRFLYTFKRKSTGLPLVSKDKMKRTFKANVPYTNVEELDQAPSEGRYVEVELEYTMGGLGGLIWGYIAASSLFILPAYSGETGYYARYRVMENGKSIKRYEYLVNRKGFAWLPVLVIGWVSIFTDTEADAFEATTKQFFQDARKDNLL